MLGVMQAPAFRVSGSARNGGGIEWRIAEQWALAGVSNIRFTDARGRTSEHEEFKTLHART